MTATLLKDVRLTPDQAIAKFGDAQGNILKAHGRERSTFLFLEFGDLPNARKFIAQLLAGLSTGPDARRDTVRVISARQQLEDRKQFQKNKTDAGLFTSLLFTAAGLHHLQVAPGRLPQEDPKQAPSPIPSLGHSDAFVRGMRQAATQALLHDPQAGWSAGWWTAPGQPSPIHALLLLADDQPTRLQPAVAFVKERAVSLGLTVRVEQAGQRLLDTTKRHDIEHFGYADGVSQPLYLTDDQGAATPSPRDLMLGADELVFLPDRLSPTPATAWGSFLVFRKLQQDVAAFNTDEDETLVNALHLPDPTRESTKAFAGAMVVGRFENGTPLVKHSNNGVDLPPNVPTPGPGPDFTNDFDYSHDQPGLKCPFHAHVRKVNPRGESPDLAEAKRRITRRGIPYGSPDGPDANKGLLFVCYQRNISQQFEFMQAGWANNPDFLHGPSPATHTAAVGLDPVIGQGPRQNLTFPTAWSSATTKPAKFGQHVHLQGGEYFYAPSMSGLKALADGTTKG